MRVGEPKRVLTPTAEAALNPAELLLESEPARTGCCGGHLPNLRVEGAPRDVAFFFFEGGAGCDVFDFLFFGGGSADTLAKTRGINKSQRFTGPTPALKFRGGGGGYPPTLFTCKLQLGGVLVWTIVLLEGPQT